eukprot:scaffold16276_cov73-Phaeocystis_antarctica.AAC.3
MTVAGCHHHIMIDNKACHFDTASFCTSHITYLLLHRGPRRLLLALHLEPADQQRSSPPTSVRVGTAPLSRPGPARKSTCACTWLGSPPLPGTRRKSSKRGSRSDSTRHEAVIRPRVQLS